MHGHGLDHAVAYFSWVNLQGAVSSLSHGRHSIAPDLRMCLMKRDATNWQAVGGVNDGY